MAAVLIIIGIVVGLGAWALCAASSVYHDEYEEDDNDE